MINDIILVLCTCPNQTTANDIATCLVQNHIAACVNILSNLTSIYNWQGSIETSNEYLLIIKTTLTVYPQLETTIKNMHPYDCPEIIATPIIQGEVSYLNWLKKAIKS